MDRLQSMAIFIEVAREGGFAPAARKLGISPASATRGVAELEERLGTQLFQRSTRSLRLTGDGAAFLPRAEAVLGELDAAERELAGRSADPRGTLYVTAPVCFGRLHVLPVVGEMLEHYPDLDARMMLVDRNIRIVEEGVDVAVRIGPLEDSALHAVHIADVRPVLVASPAYLARFGMPKSGDDLTRHRFVATTVARERTQWQPLGGPPPVEPRLHLNAIDSLVASAKSGVGLVGLLSYQVEEDVRAGRLVEITGLAEPKSFPVSLVFDAARGRTPAVRRFIELMREGARRDVGFVNFADTRFRENRT